MDFKVIFKDTFLNDLERLVRLVAGHNPTAARKLGVAEFQQKCPGKTGELSGGEPTWTPPSGRGLAPGGCVFALVKSANKTRLPA